jgi:hypothetical protein
MSNIQYLTIENCKSRNEIQIFEIMEYYTAVFAGEKAVFISEEMHQETKDWANGIRNKAREILNSRLQGDDLLALQSLFLAKFNQFVKFGTSKFPTNFDEFLKDCYISVDNTLKLHYKTPLFPEIGVNDCHYASIDADASPKQIIDNFKVIHRWILTGKYRTDGMFIQA